LLSLEKFKKQEDKSMKKLLIVAVAITALLLASFAAAVQLPGPLVDTEWLAKNMGEKQLVIVDVRLEDDIGKYGFIPNARLWKWADVRVDRIVKGVALEGMLPTKEQFETLMKNLGVNNDSVVVIVPVSSTPSTLTMGTRAYWTFKYFGFKDVALLDGGTFKWIAEKREVLKAPSEVKAAGNFKVKSEDDSISASTEEIIDVIKNKNVQLIDGRTPDFYLGKKKKDYVYAKGHIPGSKNIPHTSLINPDTKTFRPVSELKQLFSDNGIDVNKPAITYCDSGHLSTGLWFVLHELLGNKNVKQYDGSMHEWTKDANRPVTTEKE
jgi:thiosulfate/3-mercaptopyruvate sulfurtransferase